MLALVMESIKFKKTYLNSIKLYKKQNKINFLNEIKISKDLKKHFDLK